MCFIELVTLVLEGVDTPLVVDEQHGPAHGHGHGHGHGGGLQGVS